MHLRVLRITLRVNHLKEGDSFLPSGICEMWKSRVLPYGHVRYLTTMHVLESRQGSGTAVGSGTSPTVTGMVETYDLATVSENRTYT